MARRHSHDDKNKLLNCDKDVYFHGEDDTEVPAKQRESQTFAIVGSVETTGEHS